MGNENQNPGGQQGGQHKPGQQQQEPGRQGGSKVVNRAGRAVSKVAAVRAASRTSASSLLR